MIKIAVFDSGFGGDIYAKYLEEELGVAEVISIVDWKNFPYSKKSKRETQKLVERALSRYIEKFDLIILSDMDATVHCLAYLRKKYPKQLFISVPFLTRTIKPRSKCTAIVLSTKKVINSEEFCKILKKSDRKINYTVVECDDWLDKLEDGTLLRGDIEEKFKDVPTADFVLLEYSGLIDIKNLLEDYFEWRSSVLDAKLILLSKVCRVLKLKNDYGRRLPNIFR